MQTKKFVFNVVALLVVAAFVLTACGTAATPTAAPATKPRPPKPLLRCPDTAMLPPPPLLRLPPRSCSHMPTHLMVPAWPRDIRVPLCPVYQPTWWPPARQKASLTIIATPPNWANYGEIFADFEATTGVTTQFAGSQCRFR